MRTGVLSGWLCIVMVLAGCASVRVATSEPPVQRVSTAHFDALLQPQPAPGRTHFNSFRFVITNKTERAFSIDWDDTYYLLNGRRQGRFGWEGMSPGDLHRLYKNPVVTVAPGTTQAVVIFPLALLAAVPLDARARLGGAGSEDQAALGVLPTGPNAMELTVLQDGDQFRETLTLRIKTERR